jgi:hemerythrin-like domain-containing protein
MASVGEFKPNLQQQTELLLAEHQDFRAALDSIVPAMDALSKDEQQQFEQLCQEIRALLQRIDEHDRKEVEILQEALLSDEGGEGG